MGTTLGSLHLYTRDRQLMEEAQRMGYTAMCLSDGWISILDRSFQVDVLNKEAKRISKAVDALLLSFFLFDDDYVTLELWKNGRRIFEYTDCPSPAMKGVSELEQSLALDKKDMRKLRLILHCEDAQRKSELLEEFLGVALMIDQDSLSDEPDTLIRQKGCILFDEYQAEQNRLKSIKNRTKAVLVQEIHAKLADVMNHLSLSYPDSNGIHPYDKVQPCALQNGVLKPLFQEEIRIRHHSFILINGDRATVLEPVCTKDGMQEFPMADQFALGGIKLKQFPIPDGLQPFSCMLDDGSIIAQETEVIEIGGWGHNWLTCISPDGSIQWRTSLEDGSFFYNNAFAYGQHIYVYINNVQKGVTIYKIDLLGNICCQRYFPHAQQLFLKHLHKGGLICAIEQKREQRNNCCSIMVLNEDLSIRSILDISHEVWPNLYMNFDEAAFDEQEVKLYFTAYPSKIGMVDLDEGKYHVERSPDLHKCILDKNGLLYSLQGASTVHVYHKDFQQVSMHRLKGRIVRMQSSDGVVYAITSAGDSFIWGTPENCIVRVYQIDKAAKD